MDKLLQNYRDQQGGIFDYYFDEEKAKKVLEEFIPLSVRDSLTCKCDDQYCPHKSRISPLALLITKKELEKCLIPRKTLFEALKCDEYEIRDNKEGEYNSVTANQKFYDRQRVKYEIKDSSEHGGKNKNNHVFPVIHRGIFEIVEGIEFINPKVKFVHFIFNGVPLIVQVKNNDNNKKIFVKCPFLIVMTCIPYVQLKIEFHDSDNNDLKYDDFNSWIIGGTLHKYNLIDNIKPVCIEFKNGEDEIGCACYKNGMVLISSEQTYHGGCTIIPDIIKKKREKELEIMIAEGTK